MADAGGGGTYYIDRPDQAVDVFASEIDGLLELSAQNLSATVTPAEGAELTVVRHSYPSSQKGDGLRLEMGDLYAREPRELLAEFGVRVPGGRDDVATVVLSAHVLTAGGGMEWGRPLAHGPLPGRPERRWPGGGGRRSHFGPPPPLKSSIPSRILVMGSGEPPSGTSPVFGQPARSAPPPHEPMAA